MGSELPRTGAASLLGLSCRLRRKREGHDESAGSLGHRWRGCRDSPAFGVPALDPPLAYPWHMRGLPRRKPGARHRAITWRRGPRERRPVILKLQYCQTGDLVSINPMINR